jgi:hypothetical protein
MKGSPIGLAGAVVLALFTAPTAASAIEFDYSYQFVDSGLFGGCSAACNGYIVSGTLTAR